MEGRRMNAQTSTTPVFPRLMMTRTNSQPAAYGTACYWGRVGVFVLVFVEIAAVIN